MTRPIEGIQRGMLGVLLFASVLGPVAAGLLGWSIYPRPTAPIAIGVAAALGLVLFDASRHRPAVRALYVALTLLAALAFAVILRIEANAFYTSTALFGGMVILLALHVAAVAMRRVVIRDADAPQSASVAPVVRGQVIVAGLERLPPNEIRVVRAGRA